MLKSTQLLAAALLLLAAGCGGATEPDTQGSQMGPTPTSTRSETPSEIAPSASDELDSPDAEAPFYANTEPDTNQAEGDGVAVVTEVQITTHDGFDRLEFEIGGEMQVGWDVRYVESPRSQGSGDPVEVEGRAVLEVVLEPVVYPFDAPEGAEPYDGPKTLSPTVTSAIVHVVNDTIYEGRHVFFVGIDEVLPFRVQRADNPQRVVLEVLHPAD